MAPHLLCSLPTAPTKNHGPLAWLSEALPRLCQEVEHSARVGGFMKMIFLVAAFLATNVLAASSMARPKKSEPSDNFNCHWTPLPRSTSGNGMIKGVETAIDCFSQVRLIYMRADHDSQLPGHLRRLYHSEVSEVTFLDEQQHKITCRIRPLKARYDFVSEADVLIDRAANDGDLSEEMKAVIENNIELECPLS